MKFMIINGPNLDMLGVREPELYGSESYAALEAFIADACGARGIDCEILRSNHEGEIVEFIHRAFFDHFDAIVINPAAYTHTSVAILDALKAVGIPAVEVHLTDVSAREPFRHISYPGMACLRTYAGYGFAGYEKGIDFLCDYLGGQLKLI